MKNRIVTLIAIFLIGITTVSCQKSNPILEYGNPIDLEKTDWEKQDLDKTFSKIVYAKKITFKKSDSIYKGNTPLKIQWFFNYNTDNSLLENKIDEDNFKSIQSNGNFLTPYEIYRTYLFASNEELEKKVLLGIIWIRVLLSIS